MCIGVTTPLMRSGRSIVPAGRRSGAPEALPMTPPSETSTHHRIAGRRLRIGLYDNRANQILAKKVFAPGSDVTIGKAPDDGFVLPTWSGSSLRLISAGQFLHLEAGMRLHMCHDDGEDRVVGEFDDLVALGLTPPIQITVSKLNIRIRDGLTIFAKYLTEDEPDWPESGPWA
jgi:hypothetical protein